MKILPVLLMLIVTWIFITKETGMFVHSIAKSKQANNNILHKIDNIWTKWVFKNKDLETIVKAKEKILSWENNKEKIDWIKQANNQIQARINNVLKNY